MIKANYCPIFGFTSFVITTPEYYEEISYEFMYNFYIKLRNNRDIGLFVNTCS